MGRTIYFAAGALLVIGLLTIGPMIYGIFRLDEGWLRAWAVVATLALPLTCWIGYALGRNATQATLDGLDRGVKAVMSAADQTADIRDRSYKKTIQHAKPQFNVAIAPQLPKVEHTDLIEGEAKRVDL